MDWRDYAKFLIIGIISLFVGGLVVQALGLSGQQSLFIQFIAIAIPLTIFYFVLKRFAKS